MNGTETLPPAVVEAAKAGRPYRADNALREWCEQSLGLRIRSRVDSEGRVTETVIRGAADSTAISAALAAVERLMRPAPAEFIGREIAKCWAVTKARETDDADLSLATLVFQERLSIFPPDVIADAFRSWADANTFRPSLAEIRELCWREYRRRTCLKDALELWLSERQPAGDAA